MMKLFLAPMLLLFPILTWTQITFEAIVTPRDFSIGEIRRSPSGEYFIQAVNDQTTIYTSMDGLEWTEVSMPVAHELYDIQYFSDGTPLMKPKGAAHMIRRNDTLYTMNDIGGDFVKASFIKDDTLFVYDNHRFAYSLDRGQNFTTVCTYNGQITDHRAQLWKFDHHFVLHHTAGTTDMLSVFNQSGERVLSDTLDLRFGAAMTYNSCGQVLFNDHSQYYLLKEEGLVYEIGISTFEIPPFANERDFQSAGGNYYVKSQNVLYRTDGCDFVWEPVTSSDWLEFSEKMWIDENGDIYLLNEGNDFYTLFSNFMYENYFPEISHASVIEINESGKSHQFARTINNFHSKTINDEQWEPFDSIDLQGYQFKYAPNGDLYIVGAADIFYSKDNSHSFTTISLPFLFHLPGASLQVLADSILFVYSDITRESFYSLNNGFDWLDPGVGILDYNPTVKKVGNEIMIADGYNLLRFFRVNVNTGELTIKTFANPEPPYSSAITILDDGTFYVQAFNGGSDLSKYYRFRFGEELTFLGSFPQLESLRLASSGNLLYAFGQDEYFLYNGQDFISNDYINLNQPDLGYTHFIVSENEYLYALVNQTEVYRSTEPLSIIIGTKEPDFFLDFSVFPNPASDMITLSFTDSGAQLIDSYEIIDQLGKVVQQVDYVNSQAINVARLVPGIYNLVLKEKKMIVGMKEFVKL